MIKPAIVALTVMGCDCDARLCEFVSETPPEWASISECEAALRSTVQKRSDLAYPLISGFCRETPPEATPVASLDAGGSVSRTAEAIADPPRADTTVQGRLAEGSLFVFRKGVEGYERAAGATAMTAKRIAKAVSRATYGLVPPALR